MLTQSWLNGVRSWFSQGRWTRTPSRNSIRRRQQRSSHQVSSELLEERILLSAIVVTGTGDSVAVDGFITLREAMTSVNSGVSINADVTSVGAYGVNDTINFNIGGLGVQTISPLSPLPTIVKTVAINGYSQPGSSANTSANSDNAVLLIELNGTNAGLNANGLLLGLGSSGSSVSGLVINRFSGTQILVQSDGNTITGNFIGTTAAGNAGASISSGFGIEIDGHFRNTIGGTTPAARNVIGGNSDGINLNTGSQNNLIQGNFIGLGADGTTAVGNRLHGVVLQGNGGLGVQNNEIGGTVAGAGNTIANNGFAGVAVFGDSVSSRLNTGNTFLGNSIFNNGLTNTANLLGIDLVGTTSYPADDGATANDLGDSDSGPNFLQNSPVLTSATSGLGSTTIVGTLNSNSKTTYRIEFFSSPTASGTGFGEGQTFLGFTNVTTDLNGDASFSAIVAASVPSGQFVTATATSGGTATNGTPTGPALILGTAANFAVLAGTTATNTAVNSTIIGDIGVSPGLALTGPFTTTGTIHLGDAVALQAQNDLTTAFNSLAAMPVTLNLTGLDLGGMVLTPGVYKFNSSAQLTGTLTLDTLGDPHALFVFEIGSTLTTASGSSVVVKDGLLDATDDNIYWQVGSSATIETGTAFVGNIVAFASITLTTGATLASGRALARNGAVTMDGIVADSTTPSQNNTSEFSNAQQIPIVGVTPIITSNGSGTTASINVPENTTFVTDVDATGGPALVFSIDPLSEDAASFSIDSGTGVLSFVSPPDFENAGDFDVPFGVYEVTVQVTNAALQMDTQAISVTVLDVNEAPTITSDLGGPTAIVLAAENQTAVTTVVATDQDALDTQTYSITGGLDQLQFNIDLNSGVLTFITAPNFEIPTDNGGNGVYDVVVTVSDSGLPALTDSQSISVTVTDANDAPVITSNGGLATASISVNENSTTVTTVIATDEDLVDTKTFSLAGGDDQAAFSINPITGALTFNIPAPDFENPGDFDQDNVFQVTVRVTDALGAFDTQDISVSIQPVNDNTPVINGGATASFSVDENTTALATVTAADADMPAPTLMFSILPGLDAAKFNITPGGLLTFSSAPDFEIPADAGLNGVYDVTVQVSDGANTSTQLISVTVLDANDPPTATNMTQLRSYTEGAASVALNDIVVSDQDAGDTITATLTLINTATGSLTATSGNGETYVAGTGVWTVSGSVTVVNAALAAVAFVPTTNNDLDTTISTLIRDAAMTGPAAGTITLDVTPANDPPTATNLTQLKSYTEGAASVALDDVVVSDVDTGEIITATLTLANTATGSLTATSGNGETYTAGTGVWTLTGTVTAVNAALAAVAFVPTTNNDVDTTISTLVRDAANTGPAAGTITLDANGQNDPPTATNLTQLKSYTEGAASVALDDIVVSDVDAGETITAALTLANPSAGSLTATSGNGETYTAGTGVWAVTGSVAVVNAALAAAAFVPTTNNDVDTTINSLIRDAAGTGPTAGTITLDANGQNDPPTATNLTQLQSYTQGAASVALDDIVVSDVDTGETITATLTLANTATGALTATSGNGETYTAGTGVWTVTGTVAVVNAALAAVAFQPTLSNSVDTTISTLIRDAANTGPIAGTFTLDATASSNNPPVITSNGGGATANISVAENLTTVTTVVATDADPTDTLTYSKSGVDAARLSINPATGVLTFNPAPDFEIPTDVGANNVYQVTVTATDSVGATDSQDLSVTVTDVVLEFPGVTLTVSPGNLNEDSPELFTFTFTRDSILDIMTVNFAITGTATFVTDFTQSLAGAFSGSPGIGSVAFGYGQSTALVFIDPKQDQLVEPNETVTLTLLPGSNYVPTGPDTATATIIDDDTTVSLAISPASVTEDGVTTLDYTFTREGLTNTALTVNFIADGTATFGSDYSQTGATSFSTNVGSVTFLAGSSTAVVHIDPTADTTVEANETVRLTLITGLGYYVVSPSVAIGTITNDDVAPIPEVNVTISPATVTEDGVPNLKYTFTRSALLNDPLAVSFGVSGGATFVTDYTQTGSSTFNGSAGTVTFGFGQSSATVTVNPKADSIIESDETVVLTLGAGSGYTVGLTNVATGTILTDDTAVSVAVSPSSVTEDGAANLVYSFTRTGLIASPLTVNFGVNGIATFGSDYAQSGAASFSKSLGSITFLAGFATALVTIDPTGDSLVESNESVVLSLNRGTGYAIGSANTATGTITNDDVILLPSVSVAVSPSSVLENGTPNLIYTFTRSSLTSDPLTVNFTVSGTATLATDYTQSGASTFSGGGSGSVTFGFGQTTASVTINPKADAMVELDETVVLTLTSGTGYTVSATAIATGTITNDDALSTVTLAVSPASVMENGSPNMSYTFTRTGSTALGLTVNFTVGGTATFVSDYTQTGAGTFSASAGSVSFGFGQSTATVIVNPKSDSLVELDETVCLTLANSPNYTVGTVAPVKGTIKNDDIGVSVSVAPGSVAEDGNTNLVYTFTRVGPLTNPLTVKFVADGSATFATDYTQTGAASFGAGAGMVTIPALATSATVTINPTVDSIVEADETVRLTVATGTGYAISSPNTAIGTIANDDVVVPPSVSLTVSPASVLEDGTPNLLYTFTRSSTTTNPLTINFTVGGTATFTTDYTQSGSGTFSGGGSGSVSFGFGQTIALVTVNPKADTTIESDESVILTLVNGTGYTLGGSIVATGTILNDETTPVVSVSVSPSSVFEDGSQDLVYTFTRSTLINDPLTVNFIVSGAAVFGSDYTQSGASSFSTIMGTVSFGFGQMTAILVINPTSDSTVESNEEVTLSVIGGTGYSIGAISTAIGMIVNDDR